MHFVIKKSPDGSTIDVFTSMMRAATFWYDRHERWLVAMIAWLKGLQGVDAEFIDVTMMNREVLCLADAITHFERRVYLGVGTVIKRPGYSDLVVTHVPDAFTRIAHGDVFLRVLQLDGHQPDHEPTVWKLMSSMKNHDFSPTYSFLEIAPGVYEATGADSSVPHPAADRR